MSLRFALTRAQMIGFSALALVLAGTVAIAAPATSNGQRGANTSTDQCDGPHGRGQGHMGHGMGPFAHFDQDGDGKIALKDLPEKPKSHLATIDTNKDGTLTREEFEQGRSQLRALREKAMDTNSDGAVTAEERKAFMQARFAEHFNADDKNKDGFLTENEIPKPRFEHLRVADKNKDGKLAKSELDEAFANGTIGPRAQGKGGHDKAGHGPRNETDRNAHRQERFSADDKNKDGYLTQAEIPQRWDRMKVADSNGDNRITLAELTSAFESGKIGPRGGHGRGGHGRGGRQ